MSNFLKHLLRGQKRMEFIFDGGSFGTYNKYNNPKIKINLPSFTTGSHNNNGKKKLKKYTNINDIIEAVCYTINHEDIHEVQDKVVKCNTVAMERIVYNMIGNGKNGFFNVYYEIPSNIKWIKTLDPEYGHVEAVKKAYRRCLQ